MSRIIAMVAIAFAFGWPMSSWAAQVYKCTDSAGKTVYSGQPCELGSKALPISGGTPNAPRKESHRGDSGKTKSVADAAASCAQARRDLAAVESKPTPSGVADADTHRQTIERLKAQAKSACDEPAAATSPGSAKTAQGAGK